MKTISMRLVSLALLCTTLILAGFSADAEARRLGGGRSFGMQRQVTPPPAPAPAPSVTPKAPSAPAAAPAPTPPRRSWLGPIAGLAAGLGLAALASHFGFGEELASFMLIALLAIVVLAVVRRFTAPARRGDGLAYAGNAPVTGTSMDPLPPSSHGGSGAGSVPADFDREGFARQAKLNFIRLQAANDRGDLNDLREFTTPEFFAEVALQFDERGRGKQQTDVVTLDAEVLEAVTEGALHVASVRFHGLLREEGAEQPAAPFDEIWHLQKPVDGGRGWVVAGIQQTH